ncbi:hypothetical protein [Brevundimonas diminuta]|uniref:hypothetical protein n=1 Tax=Brevundimonas diminuta TaxID=293 RepID=UPI000B355AFD|nr:hypothetical protein [Brevundimonas diminuta]
MNKLIIAGAAALVIVGGVVAANAILSPEPTVPASTQAMHEVGPGFFVVAVQPNADPATFEDLAGLKCLDVDNCMVGFWKHGEEPTALPFTEAQIKAQLFAYAVNRETGFKRVAWDCASYPATPRKDCIAKAG